MEPLVINGCHGELIWYSGAPIVDYRSISFTEIFAFFNDGLSKSSMTAMADGFTSTVDLSPYVLDRLFDSFSDVSLSDVDDRNNVNDDIYISELSSHLMSKGIPLNKLVRVSNCD